jgi:hypothetical protein
VLSQSPQIRLLAGETHAVNARLLPGAHADGLPIGDKATRIGLCVLERDPGDGQIARAAAARGP